MIADPSVMRNRDILSALRIIQEVRCMYPGKVTAEEYNEVEARIYNVLVDHKPTRGCLKELTMALTISLSGTAKRFEFDASAMYAMFVMLICICEYTKNKGDTQ